MAITPTILYYVRLAERTFSKDPLLIFTIGPQFNAHSRQEMVAMTSIVPNASIRLILSHNDSFWRNVVFDSRKKKPRMVKEIPPRIMFSQKSCDRIMSEFLQSLSNHDSFFLPSATLDCPRKRHLLFKNLAYLKPSSSDILTNQWANHRR